jgi:hypothetical protein
VKKLVELVKKVKRVFDACLTVRNLLTINIIPATGRAGLEVSSFAAGGVLYLFNRIVVDSLGICERVQQCYW